MVTEVRKTMFLELPFSNRGEVHLETNYPDLGKIVRQTTEHAVERVDKLSPRNT